MTKIEGTKEGYMIVEMIKKSNLNIADLIMINNELAIRFSKILYHYTNEELRE